MGDVMVDGVEESFSGAKAHLDGGVSDRGWDRIVDGGATKSLMVLMRGAFDLRMAASSLALTIEAASHDLRRCFCGTRGARTCFCT